MVALSPTFLTAGGSFVTGGYNVTIFVGAGNPLEGRMAWGDSSGGYITTTVNLGANVNGQTIKLRFRMGTDEASPLQDGALTMSPSPMPPVP